MAHRQAPLADPGTTLLKTGQHCAWGLLRHGCEKLGQSANALRQGGCLWCLRGDGLVQSIAVVLT
jgi:hypothetical protein